MKPLIIYHDKCTDGFGAAFAAWMKLGDSAEYLPMSHGDGKFSNPQDIREHVDGRDVYILDFSFPYPVMEQMFTDAGRVIWLDHHKTAFEMWCPGEHTLFKDEAPYAVGHPENNIIVLDNNKSGALLAWEYFHPNVPVPELISRIDDRDRWVFAIPDSKALHAGLAAMQPWTFPQWETLCFAGKFDLTVQRGTAILSAQDANVSRMAAQAMPCEIVIIDRAHPLYAEGLTGLTVNACIHQSELGHVVATKSGTYALIWYLAADGRANCSLRSNGDYDVSAIAKAFGGGGHRNAAGFQIDVQTLLGWLE